MNLFTNLYHAPELRADERGPVERRHLAIDAHFATLVGRSPFRLWNPGDEIASTGRRLLIGVATWSADDMALLDAMAEAARSDSHNVYLDVFNVADCASQADVARYIPGLFVVHQTPVVGLWKDGVLIESTTGKDARELVARVCELPAL